MSSLQNSSLQRYHAHGLTFASALPIPELMPSQQEPHVTIRYGSTPDELTPSTRKSIFYQFQPQQSLLDLRKITGARFLIRNGNEIVVERFENAQDDLIRLFLLGSCMAILLTQRGLLPLHSSAILAPQGAMLFTGPSTVGKSTLAAAFLRRGYPVLADDISAVHYTPEGQPRVSPELLRLKLWTNSLNYFEVGTESLARIRPELEKYGYPLGEAVVTQPAALRTLYVLHQHNTPTIDIRPIQGFSKLTQVRVAIYRSEYLSSEPIQSLWFERLSKLAQAIQVRKVRFPHDFTRFTELVDHIEQDFQR
jgi:hypothetical protein